MNLLFEKKLVILIFPFIFIQKKKKKKELNSDPKALYKKKGLLLIQMDRERLMKMASAVRTGGKGSIRRCD